MSKRRNPKFYSGTRTTAHPLKDLLTPFLEKVRSQRAEKPEEVIAYWSELMGSELAPFSRAETFAEGILTVRVLNKALLALLAKQEKPRLLKRLREAFPHLAIKSIEFRT